MGQKWPVQDMGGIQEENEADQATSSVVAEEIISKTPIEEAPFEKAAIRSMESSNRAIERMRKSKAKR